MKQLNGGRLGPVSADPIFEACRTDFPVCPALRTGWKACSTINLDLLSLSSTGLGWIKADPNFSKATNTQNVPIALAPPLSTSTATPLPDTPTPTVTFTPELPTATAELPTATATPLPPSPTLTDGLIRLILWGNSSISNSLDGGGKEWFTFNSGKEQEAILIAFIRNAERVEIFVYHGRDSTQWPPGDPNAIPNLGIAGEEAINRDNNDRTREFVWRGPVTPNTQYFVRMINWGQVPVFYCILTKIAIVARKLTHRKNGASGLTCNG
jgi:PPE-repeat protein